jgi:hypothetical protein
MIVIGVTFAAAVLIIIGVDIYLAITQGFNGTLSYWMLTMSVKYPILPFAFGLVVGLLGGHFFWDQLLNVTACPGMTSQ